jgi:CheY-like chemotaxis protein/HPt (histidine-containing phosphotransfer) domain-containing protein
MLGGDISVRSTAGEGSTFLFTLDPGPVDRLSLVPASVAQAWQPPPLRETQTRGGLAGRLLLAEDVPDNQRLISHYLQKAGATVELAENGRIACEMVLAAAAEGRPFDAVLMDIQMPEMNGYAATTRLRSAGYARPVIALTAHAMPADRERCLAAGCDDVVTKPIAADLLIEKLRQYLGGGEPRRRAPAPCLVDARVPSRPATEADEVPAVLCSTLAADPEVRVLVETFIGRLPLRIDAIQASLARRDLPALASHAHQLKGTAGGYGFPALSDAAATLEASAKMRRPLDEVERAARLVIDLCRRVRVAPHGASPDEALRERARVGT